MAGRAQVLFSEAQSLKQWHTRIVLAFPPAAALFITLRQIVWHKPWGSPPTSDGGLIFLSVLLTAVYFRLITVKLITELRPREIAVGLHGLWKRRRIPLEQVESARAVTYDAVADFGGYGIRSGRRGTAYIARGNQAVELTLSGGRHVFLGSAQPAEWAQKIMEARRQGTA